MSGMVDRAASSPAPGTGAGASGRVAWIDTAKGIAILMVALAHSVQWLSLTGLTPGVWDRINLVFIVFRMPLFFLASGLFAGSILARSWPALWRTRLSLLVWALLVWTLVRFGFFVLFPTPTGMDETSLVDLVLAPVRPSNGLWFLYALALFFVVMKLLRNRVDWRLQLGAAALLSVWFFARADTGNIAWNGICRYLVFFMIGCFFRDQIIRFVERRGLWAGLLFGAAFLAATLAVLASASRVPFITGVLTVVSLCAIGAGLVIARFLTRFRGMAWLTFIGRNTLPVYVVHVLFVSAITSLLLLARGQRWLEVLGPVLPLLVAGLAVGCALGFWRLTRNLPVLRLGYVAPDWFAAARPATAPRHLAESARPVERDPR
jgi:uncharacterized membrane protein YcfT